MDATAFFQILGAAIKTTENLAKFVRNDMANLLESIGDASLAAAKKALNDQKLSFHPDREVDRAVTILRQSHEIFRRQRQKSSKTSISWKSYQISLTIAISYMHLNEPVLARKYLGESAEDLQFFANLAVKNEQRYIRQDYRGLVLFFFLKEAARRMESFVDSLSYLFQKQNDLAEASAKFIGLNGFEFYSYCFGPPDCPCQLPKLRLRKDPRAAAVASLPEACAGSRSCECGVDFKVCRVAACTCPRPKVHVPRGYRMACTIAN